MSDGLAYYNEFDPHAAAWLRNLADAGEITPGTVDGRDIRDVTADDVRGFRRVHFFAGIAGWELALAIAGWPADRPVWTGSCPCPPFSSAGKKKRCPECGGGRPVPCPRRTGYFICVECEHAWHADARHLWPELFRLVRDCRPPTVIGEQVSGPDGRIWFAGVRACLERIGYAVGALDLAAAGVGSPHIRQRLFWVAHAQRPFRGPDVRRGLHEPDREGSEWEEAERPLAGSGSDAGPCRVADAHGRGLSECRQRDGDPARSKLESSFGDDPRRCGPDGHWSDFDVIPCRDGKVRRVESGSFPLVARLPKGVVPGRDPGVPIDLNDTPEARGLRLKGYGNAIVPQVAAEFIAAFLEAEAAR